MGTFFNKYEVAGRAKKVARLKRTIDSLPQEVRTDLAELIASGECPDGTWVALHDAAGVRFSDPRTRWVSDEVKRTLQLQLHIERAADVGVGK